VCSKNRAETAGSGRAQLFFPGPLNENGNPLEYLQVIRFVQNRQEIVRDALNAAPRIIYPKCGQNARA
jgi:hypothetical protein